jgi:hypothetical protein
MLHATCYMLHAICYMLHATCYMLHAICYMLHYFSTILTLFKVLSPNLDACRVPADMCHIQCNEIFVRILPEPVARYGIPRGQILLLGNTFGPVLQIQLRDLSPPLFPSTVEEGPQSPSEGCGAIAASEVAAAGQGGRCLDLRSADFPIALLCFAIQFRWAPRYRPWSSSRLL